MALTSKQLETFDEMGFVIVEDFLFQDDLQEVRDELSDWIDEKARKLKDEGKIDDLAENEPFETRIAHLYAQYPDFAGGMDIMNLQGRATFKFLSNPALLDAVESIVGPEITCNPIQHVRPTYPERMVRKNGAKQVTPWHQDSGVTWPEADDTNIITVWIPLVDATIERGCMQVLPQAHKFGHMDHKKAGGTTIVPAQFPRGIWPIAAECLAGGAIFMSKFTPHHSLVNKADVVRWSMDLRYQPNWEPTGRPFHPEFVVRSPSKPESVLDRHEDWVSLWNAAFKNNEGKTINPHRTVY